LSDAVLIYTPIYLIWPTSLPEHTKIRLVGVFAATLITTSISLYKIYVTIRIGGLKEELAAIIEVILTYVY
jgi:hypothetical protein